MSEIVVKTGITKKKGYLYYIDKKGDVRASMMAQFKRDNNYHTKGQAMDGVKKKAVKSTKKKTPIKKVVAKKKVAKKKVVKKK